MTETEAPSSPVLKLRCSIQSTVASPKDDQISTDEISITEFELDDNCGSFSDRKFCERG